MCKTTTQQELTSETDPAPSDPIRSDRIVRDRTGSDCLLVAASERQGERIGALANGAAHKINCIDWAQSDESERQPEQARTPRTNTERAGARLRNDESADNTI